MKYKGMTKMSLLNRIICFLVAFTATIVLQMTISRYQSVRVLDPLEERTGSIQAISQFFNDVEGCMTALENYRWDFGDTEELIATLRQRQEDSRKSLAEIDRDLRTVSEEQYLLANAAATTYETFSLTLDQIMELLEQGKSDEAAALYYEKALPCGSYMGQYIQQLLERAIKDNQSAYVQMNQLNEKLKQAQSVILILCFILGIILIISLLALLKSVKDMARASQEISQGNLDAPDVDETLQDEIGDMAKAFNEMKRSMKRQVELLNEKNEMERELHTKETEALELQNLMERARMQQLRSQINPHFLFNTLNVILYSSKQERAVKTHGLIGSLSSLFRYALGSNEDQVPLSREVRIVDEFYALQQARFGERMKLKWSVSAEIVLTETLVPSFILQPLVENSFRHGLGPKEEGGCVEISIEPNGETLIIQVADNGVGMTAEKLQQFRENLKTSHTDGEHIGAYNVAARLRLWGDEYGMKIQSEEGVGTRSILRMPLVILEEEEEEPDDQDPDCG